MLNQIQMHPAKGHFLRRSTVVVFLNAALLSGCVTQQTALPGGGIQSPSLEVIEPIKEADVLAALKCQMARGFIKVEELKAASTHPAAAKFNFKKGTAVFSGSFTLAEENGATINALIPFIPFSGWGGSTHTPSLGGSIGATSVQKATRTMAVTPTENPTDLALCDLLEANNIEPGAFVTESIVNAFLGAVSVPLKVEETAEPYGPILTSAKHETETTFTIVRKRTGGFAVVTMPAGADLSTLSPGLTLSDTETFLYSLKTSLPTIVGEPADSRRLIRCTLTQSSSLCVEEPFTPARYEELQAFSIQNKTSRELALSSIQDGFARAGEELELDPDEENTETDRRDTKEAIEEFRSLLQSRDGSDTFIVIQDPEVIFPEQEDGPEF